MTRSAMCLMEISHTRSLTAPKVNEVILSQLLIKSRPLYECVGMAQDYGEEFFTVLGASIPGGTLLPQAYQHGCASEIHSAKIITTVIILILPTSAEMLITTTGALIWKADKESNQWKLKIHIWYGINHCHQWSTNNTFLTHTWVLQSFTISTKADAFQ